MVLAFVDNRQNLISIPYGAIKRILFIFIKSLNDKIFQFLMVRLKDLFKKIYTYIIVISIPYGAIKSHINQKFLSSNQYFNSLWCD